MKNKILRILLCSFVVSIAGTFHLSVFTNGFIISLSTVIMPFVLYLNNDISCLLLCPLIALISPLVRYLLLLGSHTPYESFIMVYPDSVFYIIYTAVFFISYKLVNAREINKLVIAAIAGDFLSNVVELTLRLGISNIKYENISYLLLISLMRGFILMILVVLTNYYRSFLIDQEHEQRYRNLMSTTASFKSEIYFMHKNMDKIEMVMRHTFEAYKIVKDRENDCLTDVLLDLSKDVHEIKKDYTRVIQGIEEIFPNLLEFSTLDVNDICQMLILNVTEQLSGKERKIIFTHSIESTLKVRSHFLFMSILSNIIQNAIESSDPEKTNDISFNIYESIENLIIEVSDTGEGIESEHMSHIFNPGFSTKFNFETGNINRGVGLSLVKNLVEEEFLGSIKVESKLDQGSRFIIEIPKMVLKGEA